MRTVLKSTIIIGWGSGFRLLARLVKSKALLANFKRKSEVLVIAPHPDDEVAGCACAILNHIQAGDRVRVVMVTNGGASKALGLRSEEMIDRRKREADAAAVRFGLSDLVQLGLPERSLPADELPEPIRRILEPAPDIIYAPSLIDFHPVHRRVAYLLAREIGMRPAAMENTQIRAYPVQVPLALPLANRLVPVDSLEQQLHFLMAAYETQSVTLGTTLRMRKYAGLLHGVGADVEEFWEMPASLFADVHRPGNNFDQSNSFRGLRTNPLTDPLAYLMGRSQRLQLANRTPEPNS